MPQFSGRALPSDARRERMMKWRARDVAAMPCHGPLQLSCARLPDERVSSRVKYRKHNHPGRLGAKEH
jgi:hypothetical protein